MTIEAPDADRLWMPLNGAGALKSIELNGEIISFAGKKQRRFLCYGRSCRAIELTLHFEASKPVPDISIISLRHGLGPESQKLLAARPLWALPQHWGDLRAVSKKLPLGAP